MPANIKKPLSVLSVSVGAVCLVALSGTASVAAATDIFSVTSLTTDSAVYVDANSLAGDDDGFLGVTGTKFVFSGDTATVAYDLSDMGNAYVTDVDNSNNDNNWLFSDLKTQTSYYFVADQIGGDPVYDITGFQPLDQTGDVSGSVIALSETVTIDNDDDYCTIFASGYGRMVIWDGCVGVIYDIELPSGEVTTVNDAATFADYDASTPLLLNYWEVDTYVSQLGVVEFDGAELHILAVADNGSNYPLGIYRYDVQSPATAPVELLSFGPDVEGADFADIWKFTVSPATNQWCSGAENGWSAISGSDNISELAFCASATFSITAGPSPEPETGPELADTGADGSAFLTIGALALLGGATLLLVARRRTATS